MSSLLLSNALEILKRQIREQKKHTQDDIAVRLNISKKTLYNWLHDADRHPIPLEKFVMLCELLELSPARMFGSGITIFPRLDDPVGAEKYALELETKLNPGEIKRVVFPLFSPPLMCDALIALYSTKGFYRRFFVQEGESKVMRNRFEQFVALRRQRRVVYEQSHHSIELFLMQQAFEDFINREHFFADLSTESVLEQLDYLLHLLEHKRWNGLPRLSLRMTPSELRMQYTLFGESRLNHDDPVALMSGNTYMYFTHNVRILNTLRREFTSLWDHYAMPELKQTDEWMTFFRLAKAHLVTSRESSSWRKFSVSQNLDHLHEFMGGQGAL